MLTLAIRIKSGKVRLFRHYINISILLLITLEFFILSSSYYFSSLIRGYDIQDIFNTRCTLYSVIAILAIASQGLYKFNGRQTHVNKRNYFGLLTRFVFAFTLSLLGISILFYLFYNHISGYNFYFGRTVLILAHLIAFSIISVVHLYFFSLIDHSLFKSRTLVLGSGSKASTLLQLRRKTDLRNNTITAYVKNESDRSLELNKLNPVSLDWHNNLKSYAINHKINEIVVALDERRQTLPIRQLIECKMAGINVIDLVSFLERETGKIRVDLIDPSWLIFTEGFDQNKNREMVKRFMDVLLSVFFIIVFLPIMVITGLAIFLTGQRNESILYKQTRIGLLGKPFTIYKFRSMVSNAEAPSCCQWAQDNDKRVTKVGKVIRKYRIDELPQLVNVLKGDMSFVGPRPERPEFVTKLFEHIPYYQERHCVKPGITGWAQVNYPYGDTIEKASEKLQYDLYYVKNNSLFLDIAILLQTVGVILFKQGSR
jgi:sugar transferase (PEP-CTERM system associated)